MDDRAKEVLVKALRARVKRLSAELRTAKAALKEAERERAAAQEKANHSK